MTIPVVWSDDCLLHVPGGEVWVGVRTPGTEAPERLPAIRDALAEAGHPFVPATAHGDDPILAVHDAALLEYLADAYPDWVAAGFPDDPGQDRVVGYLFPHRVCCPDFRCVRPQPHTPARAVSAMTR